MLRLVEWRRWWHGGFSPLRRATCVRQSSNRRRKIGNLRVLDQWNVSTRRSQVSLIIRFNTESQFVWPHNSRAGKIMRARTHSLRARQSRALLRPGSFVSNLSKTRREACRMIGQGESGRAGSWSWQKFDYKLDSSLFLDALFVDETIIRDESL